MNDLRVRVLGPFAVDGFDVQAMGSRKARTLLKVLTLARGAPVSVDRLVECCWGDEPPGKPADQVSVLVSRLRGVLGRDRIVHGDGGYRLVLDWLDLDVVAELADEARRRLGAGSAVAARAAADAALALVRGPLLADEPDIPWADVDRAAAERLAAGVRHVGAEAALVAGDGTGAADLAHAALDHDPYDERALRVLMAAHVVAGRPASALAAYARVRERLVEDLGVDPSDETEAVHTAILRAEPLPGFPMVTADEPGRSPAPSAAAAIPPGRSAAFAALDNALAGIGDVSLVTVEGEAGIGKTTVLDAWCAHASSRGVRVVRGRCDELERALPLQVVLDAIAEHLRELDESTAFSLLGPDRGVLAPLLGRRGEEAADTPVGELTDAETGRAGLFAALLGVLGRIGAGAPLVLALDDVHLAGPSTVDWLHYAVRRGSGLPILVVAAARPDGRAALPVTVTVTIAPLDLAAVEEVVGLERAAALMARSGGHPLFLVELAAASPEDALPASIVESVAARCEQAGAAGATLRTGAVMGSEIDLDLLAAVTHAPPVVLLEHLEDGMRRRLLDERNGKFVFCHDLVREALVLDTSQSRRALIHREAGRALRERPNAEPLDVAYHARLGGDVVLAAAAFADAARQSTERFDHETAAAMLDRSLALDDTADVRVQRARGAILTGDYTEAMLHAEAAMRMGAGAAAFEVAGWAAYFLRDIAQCRRLADDGVRLAEDPALRASCLALAGRIRHSEGDLLGGEERLREAIDGAHGPTRVIASVWLGTLRSHQGRVDEALELLRPGTYPGRAVSHTFAPMHAHMFIGHAYGVSGRAADALRAFEVFGELVERQHATRFRGRPENFTAWVLRNLGHDGMADELNEQAVEIGPHVGFFEAAIAAYFDLADGEIARGELDAAMRHLELADEMLAKPQILRWRQQLRGRSLRARAQLVAGATADAAGTACELVEEAARLGIPRYEILGRLLGARASSRLGNRVDPEAVERDLELLPRYAGLEAWWITAEVAHDLRVDRWRALADRRVAELVHASGEHGETLTRAAARRLARIDATG